MHVAVGEGGTVRLGGEIDMDGAEYLETVLARILSGREAGAPLTLDMSAVTFCDSTGLNTLLRIRLAAEHRGSRLSITAASAQVTRLFELTRTGDLLGFTAVPTRETS
ncbi:STAS domain-containing protein [Streptomyces sp. NPDC056503]|uniref:STAS domain-containing protein n=1 Tax=Streptomyces sp. NPDC056503 TaxID=3345842 RepID=UPI00368B817A